MILFMALGAVFDHGTAFFVDESGTEDAYIPHVMSHIPVRYDHRVSFFIF